MIVLRRNKIDLSSFDHEDVYRFMTYCGREMYDEPKLSSIKEDEDIKKYIQTNKFRESVLKKKVSIVLPMNHKTYDSADMFRMYNKDEEHCEWLDIIVSVANGLLIFPEAPMYLTLGATLTKYWTPSCGWNYKFYKNRGINKPPFPVITLPKNEKDWETLLKALTEFLVIYRLSYGIDPIIHFNVKSDEKVEEKKFSDIASFIPTTAILGTSLVIAPLVHKRLHLKLREMNKNYNLGFAKKFIRYINNNYKDIKIVNFSMVPCSCYINPKNLSPKVIEMIRNGKGIEKGDPKRLRTALDYIVWAYDNNKYLIFCHDLDNPLALCHELGHYLIEKEDGTARFLQNNAKRGLTHPGFIKFVGFILGLTGTVGEIAGVVSTFLLKSPLLYTEFLASYKGIEELKAAGGTEKEIEEAKKMFKLAWGTYLCSTVASTRTAALGKIIGYGYRKIKH